MPGVNCGQLWFSDNDTGPVQHNFYDPFVVSVWSGGSPYSYRTSNLPMWMTGYENDQVQYNWSNIIPGEATGSQFILNTVLLEYDASLYDIEYITLNSTDTVTLPWSFWDMWTLFAIYKMQFQVTFNSAIGGSINNASGWYDASIPLSITATPSSGYKFKNWVTTGGISISNLTSPTTNMTVTGKGSVQATFAPFVIVIYGNGNFSAENGVSNGTGTLGDPYIIKDYRIDASTATGINITNTDKYFVIRNCTVYNGGPNWDGIYLNNVTYGKVENCTTYNNTYGIYLFNSFNNTLTGNMVYNNTSNGGIILAASSNNIITNNMCYNNHHGISLDFSPNNTLTGNIAYNNRMFGIYLLDLSNNNTLTSNTAYNNSYNGICLYFCSNNTLGSNIVYNNRDSGIYLESSSSSNTLTGNIVYNNFNCGIGLYTNCTNNTLTSNTAYNNDVGVYLSSNSNNNTLTGNSAYLNEIGIRFIKCNNNILTSNIAHDNYGDGIKIDYNCSSNTLTNNSAYDNIAGFSLNGNSNNTLISNTVYDNHYSGIYLYESSNNTLTGNIAYNNMWGIYLTLSSKNTLTSNMVYNNTVHGIYLVSSSNNTVSDNTAYNNDNSGIYLYSSSNNTISGNTVHDCGIELFNSSKNTFTRNTAYNSNYGIELWLNCSSNTFTNNTAYNNIYGIYLTNSSGTEIHYCDIYNNTQYGVYNANSNPSFIVNATLCYWGSSTGPAGAGSGHGNNVSSNVLFDPWISNASIAILTIQSSVESLTVGSPVTISGSLSATRSGMVTIYQSINASTFTTLTTVSMSNGICNYSFTPSNPGTYQFKASWPGDDDYNSAESSIITVIVNKMPKQNATLSLQPSTQNITLGSTLSLTGMLTPTKPGTVALWQSINGSAFTMLDSAILSVGIYSYSFSPSVAGSYQFKASWPGDDEYNLAESPTTTVTVSAPLLPPSNATVTFQSSAGGSTTPSGSNSYLEGATIVVSANPSSGYQFSNWSINGNSTVESSTSPSTTLTVNGTTTVTAYFNPISGETFTVTFQSSVGGSTSPSGSNNYQEGASFEIVGNPSSGYQFFSWNVTGNATVANPMSASTILTVYDTAIVTAYFHPLDTNPPVITNLTPTNGTSTASGSVTISALFYDDTAIDTSSVILKVNGVLVTSGLQVTSTGITYATSLQPGTHNIELTVSDTQGNPRTATWAFTVASTAVGFPMEYIVIGIVVIAAVAAATIFLIKRKPR